MGQAPSKRQVLEQLKRDELLAAVDRFDLEVADRRVRDQLIDALGSSRKAALAEILGDLKRRRLSERWSEVMEKELWIVGGANGAGKTTWIRELLPLHPSYPFGATTMLTQGVGVANVYSHNGRLYWELPNGDLTFEDPCVAIAIVDDD